MTGQLIRLAHVRNAALALVPIGVAVLVAGLVLVGWPVLAQQFQGRWLYWFVRAQPLPILVLPAALCLGLCRLMPMHWRPVFARVSFAMFALIAGAFAYGDYLRLAPWIAQHGVGLLDALHHADPVVGAGMAAGLVAAAGTVRLSVVVPQPFKRVRGSAAYGDASFMDLSEAARTFPMGSGVPVGERYRVDLSPVHAIPFIPKDRSSWGMGWRAPMLVYDGSFGSGHELRFAGSGGFKTMSLVSACLNNGGPIVVSDPSGEILPLVRDFRQGALGREVRVLDPRAPRGFDVCDWIRTSSQKEQDIAALALMLRAESARVQTGSDAFFQDQAHNLLTGLLTHVLLSPDYDGERNLRGLRRLVTQPEKTLQELLARIHATAASRFVKETIGVFVQMTENTFSGVYSTASKDTQWLSFPEYAALVTGDDFRSHDVAQGGTDVFLNLRTMVMQAYPGIARVIVGSLANAMFQANGRHKERVIFMLDEANQYGRMRALETARDEGRKYGVSLLMIYQSLGQLEAHYGREGRAAWFDSASVISFAAVNDRHSAEEVSQRCGQITIEVEGSSRSAGMIGSNHAGRASTSTSYQKRPLILPHEVMQMRADEQILFVPGRPPLRCSRPIYFRRPELAGLVGRNRFVR